MDEFVENCSPKEISANACVFGLYQTSDKAGEVTPYIGSYSSSFNFYRTLCGPGRAISVCVCVCVCVDNDF